MLEDTIGCTRLIGPPSPKALKAGTAIMMLPPRTPKDDKKPTHADASDMMKKKEKKPYKKSSSPPPPPKGKDKKGAIEKEKLSPEKPGSSKPKQEEIQELNKIKTIEIPKTNFIDNVIQTRQLITKTLLTCLKCVPRA
jgi:hypothetical protein